MRFYALRGCLSLLPVLLVATLTPATSAAQASLHLIPQPRQVTPHGDQPLAHGVEIKCPSCDADDTFAADDLRQALSERHIPTVDHGGFHITLERRPNDPAFTAEMKPEGYLIESRPGGLNLVGATAAGLFYAAQTAKQLITLDPQGQPILHAADIQDYPVLKYRGLSDDLSRGPVDTLAYQKHLIRILAAYKDNVYSPYFENTQQYASNPLPATPGASISAADARELVAYAARYHITVIPDQEAFGHLHHDLVWEQYADIAESPHGTVLAPAQPGSLKLIDQMFTELAQLYPSPFLHIGADETVDLGFGQTKAAVQSRGLNPVYLDYLQQINKTLRPLNRRLLWWGDIAQSSPELVRALPADFKRDTVAVAWEYGPSRTGYNKFIKPFTDAGMETWIAPGINNWGRVYPDWNDAFANIQGFTRDGVNLGAVGQLDTLWNDDGETLAANNSFGIVLGAAEAWQGGKETPADFQASFGEVFHGDATGKLNQAQAELMLCHHILRDEAKLGDASDGLFWYDPFNKDAQPYTAKMRPYAHEVRLHAERALTLIAQVRAAYPAAPSSRLSSRNEADGPNTDNRQSTSDSLFPATSLREQDAIDALEFGARRIDFLALKFQLCDEIPQLYASAQADAASGAKGSHLEVIYRLNDIRGTNGRLEDIVDTYSLLREMHAELWRRTNRETGLRPVLAHYDSTLNLWYSRIDRFRSVERQWDHNIPLPSPTDLGLPPVPPSAH